MTIQTVTDYLEGLAPVSLQESYDNAGLLTGNPTWECTGIITALDVTEEVIAEAVAKQCNLVVAHHPVIFGGLKRITGKNFVERTVINAIKNDVAIYAIHTNLDNVLNGVNGRIADKLGLINRRVLQPKAGTLKKLVVFVPATHEQQVKEAIFTAGGGKLGNYSECSFVTAGKGSFKGDDNSNPFIGKVGERAEVDEVKIEVVFNAWLENKVVTAMYKSHPYEEVAFDIVALQNQPPFAGSGLLGELPEPLSEAECLQLVKKQFDLEVIRHTAFTQHPVTKVAVCGGAGSFLTGAAIGVGAQLFITSDVKYHEFFNAEGKILLADIGHYESEQFTVHLLFDLLTEKFPNFATLKSAINTNPVQYFR